MKQSDSKRVLQALFASSGLTKTELSEMLGKRKNSIGSVCNELLEQGKIRPQDIEKQRNAKLEVVPESCMTLGIEHRIDELRLVVLDAGLQVKKKRVFSHFTETGEKRVRKILSNIRRYFEEEQIDVSSLTGIGYSDFIPHDIGTGLKTKSIWMPNWGQINFTSILESEVSLDTVTMRCTDAYAVAEHVWGCCRDEEPFIVVQLGDGIGLSVYRDGFFMKGTKDVFGEIGHTIYRKDGPICKCGNRGCLEVYAGRQAVIHKVEENLTRNIGFTRRSPDEPITFEEIAENARSHNKLALMVLTDAAKAVGESLANVINVLGITKVVLYGDLMTMGDLLIGEIRDSVNRFCLYPLNIDSRILVGQLDDYSSAAGAAYVSMRQYFQ